MPGNKRRSRNGSSSASSSAAAAQATLKSSNSLTKFFTNFNGFANGSSYNGYHHHPTIAANHHQINSNTNNSINAAAVNGDSGGGGGGGNSSTSTSTNSSNNIVGGTIFTAKQQQQLDRNAFLLTLTKDQLKVECRKRGQKTNGTKTELVYCGFFSLPRPKSHTIFPNALHRNIRQFLFFFVGLYVIVCRLKFFLLYSRRNLSRWDKKFRCLDVFLFFSVFIVNDLSLDNNFIFL